MREKSSVHSDNASSRSGNKIKAVLAVLMQCGLILSLFVVAVFAVKNRQVNYMAINTYAHSTVEYANGTTARFDGRAFGMVNRGDFVTVTLSMPPQPLMQDAVLCFYIYHAVTEVRLGDRLLADYGAEIAQRGDMVGNHRFVIPLPQEAWGNDIVITFRVTENNAFNRVSGFKLYSKLDAYQYFIDGDFIGFCVAWPMLALSVTAIIILLCGSKTDVSRRKAMYIALFALLASLWIITSKGMQNLFGVTDYLCTQVEFMAVFVISLPIVLYAMETETKGSRMHALLRASATLTVLFFAVTTLLHFTNTLHYCSTLLFAEILVFKDGILLFVFAVRQRMKGGKADVIFFDGMTIMFASGMFELVRMNSSRFFPWLPLTGVPSVLPLGLLFILLYMVRSYFYEFSDKQRVLVATELQRKNLSDMLASMPAGLCLLKPDAPFTIVEGNDPFYQIIGRPKTDHATLESLLSPLLGENLEHLSNARMLISSNEKLTGHLEFPLTTASGEERTLLASYYYDKAGSNQITLNVVDISERKRMEEELRISEERYRLALSQSGRVFFFFDVPTRTMRLSQELADAFGLPMVVDNMPENFISQGLVEQESVENYRRFYARIIAGERTGDTIISCHMRAAPGQMLWYRIAFTSVFDAKGVPQSAIITYEDLSELHRSEISAQWKQQNLLAVPESEYVIVEYDLTSGLLLSQVGGLFAKLPEFINVYEEINEHVFNNFIFEEDVPRYRIFVSRDRLLEQFASGVTEDIFEYRSVQSGSTYRWTSTSVQLIRDSYSGHILGQFLFRDIHEQKAGQMAMKRTVDELQKELESSRIKVMINQMQPHFLYNALSAIRTITLRSPQRAYDLLYDFTVHLRSSIKALSSDAPIPFSDELKNIKAYLNIEMMRFGDMLKVCYEIDCEAFRVVPLTIQPLAENAARHGVYPKAEAGGTVTIRSYETFDAYVVEVEDNGVGFDVDKALAEGNNSYGLKNVIFRLKSLMNAKIYIQSTLGKGTLVKVTLPKEGEQDDEDHPG